MTLTARQEEAFRLLSVIQAETSPQPPNGIHPMDVVTVWRQQIGIY